MVVRKVEIYPGEVHIYCDGDDNTIRETITRDGLLLEMIIGQDGEYVAPMLSKTVGIWKS